MGMYTEIFFRAEVDSEAYDQMFFATQYGAGGSDLSKILPRVLMGSSAYFPEMFSGPQMIHDHRHGGAFRVEFRSSLKNYDQEIEQFFSWVAPHCISPNTEGGFIGYSLYEEDRYPSLFFADGTKMTPTQVAAPQEAR